MIIHRFQSCRYPTYLAYCRQVILILMPLESDTQSGVHYLFYFEAPRRKAGSYFVLKQIDSRYSELHLPMGWEQDIHLSKHDQYVQSSLLSILLVQVLHLHKCYMQNL